MLVKTKFLASIHVLLGLIWLSLLSFILAQLDLWLKHALLRNILEGVSSAVLIVLGVKLAFEKVTNYG